MVKYFNSLGAVIFCHERAHTVLNFTLTVVWFCPLVSTEAKDWAFRSPDVSKTQNVMKRTRAGGRACTVSVCGGVSVLHSSAESSPVSVCEGWNPPELFGARKTRHSVLGKGAFQPSSLQFLPDVMSLLCFHVPLLHIVWFQTTTFGRIAETNSPFSFYVI